MPLPSDHWPYVHFYDVAARKTVKINGLEVPLHFLMGSTKGHGPGTYYRVKCTRPGQCALTKFLSRDAFMTLRCAYKSRKTSRAKSMRSPRKSSCHNKAMRSKRPARTCKRSKKCTWVKSRRATRTKSGRKGYCRKK